MGGCQSSGAGGNSIIERSDGGEEEYRKRFLEDVLLGKGEFGEVKMVHDMTNKNRGAEPLACKALKKGVVFKDNTLYTPMKPEILRGEVEMLRKLAGRQFCLKLIAIYETPRVLYMVTEYCGGGEMMEYVGSLNEDLTTEDVSRIAFQILSAFDHCAKNQVLHRDIKPENIMFQDPSQGSPLRLIDFGSGTLDPSDRKEDDKHTTFAGTAFYTSPELFQRAYNQLTDVWSAGAVLYVLVAGYPAHELQKAFNLLQSSKRDLKTLPGMPDNMPDSYYELLDAALTYKPKLRKTAAELLEFEFTKFHQHQDEEQILSFEQIAAVAASTALPSGESSKTRRHGNVSLRGSVFRHNMFLGFKKFERSLTALLAALLSKKELDTLVTKLQKRVAQQKDPELEGPTLSENPNKQLAVISMGELKDLIREVVEGNQMYVLLLGTVIESSLLVSHTDSLTVALAAVPDSKPCPSWKMLKPIVPLRIILICCLISVKRELMLAISREVVPLAATRTVVSVVAIANPFEYWPRLQRTKITLQIVCKN